MALAQAFIKAYDAADNHQRLHFLKTLAADFGTDRAAVLAAVAMLGKSDVEDEAFETLHQVAEPRRQELMRRLNLAPGGTATLVTMREVLLNERRQHPELDRVDADFAHLFNSWFNRGFLELRHIDWDTPASILEKIIKYEAVHAIRNWDDLRNRLQPQDRRCYGFFHPQLPDEPLIFVEVALTGTTPERVQPLLDIDRDPIAARAATTAVFYSISNTQRGLAGVSFGNFLIKQVVENLKAELANITTFVTLSPVPGFARWVEREGDNLDAVQRARLAMINDLAGSEIGNEADEVREAVLALAKRYFFDAKDDKNRPLDPVARFHLGNGARLERLNFLGDISPKGIQHSYGLMVNYLYDSDQIEQNHEAFLESGHIAAHPDLGKSYRLMPATVS